MTMFNKRIWGHVAHPHFFVWRSGREDQTIWLVSPMTICVFLCPQPHGQLNILLWVCGQPSPPSPRPHATSGVCLCSAPTAHFLGVHPACSPWLRTFPSCPVQTGRPSSAKHTTQVPKYTPALSDDDLHTYSLFPLCLWKTPRQRVRFISKWTRGDGMQWQMRRWPRKRLQPTQVLLFPQREVTLMPMREGKKEGLTTNG